MNRGFSKGRGGHRQRATGELGSLFALDVADWLSHDGRQALAAAGTAGKFSGEGRLGPGCQRQRASPGAGFEQRLSLYQTPWP